MGHVPRDFFCEDELFDPRRRAFTAIFCCLLIAAGCTSEEEPGAVGPSRSPPSGVGAFELSPECTGLRALSGSQLSFVSGGEVFVARRAGSTARCVLAVPGPGDLEWGPEGDRLHFGDLRRYDGEQVVALEGDAESIAWSRPTGTSIVYVS